MLNSDGLSESSEVWQQRRARSFTAAMAEHGAPHGTFGDRMNIHSDKELSDLLDFSAMFSPPIGSNGGVKNAPQQSNQNMEFGFKPGIEEGSWNSNNPPGSFDRGMYDQNFNGQTDNMHPFSNDVPNLINNKTSDLPYRTNMPGSQGMMGSNVPMSPDSLSPGAKSPYFYNKQQDMSLKGRRGSAHGASGKRSKVSGHGSLNSRYRSLISCVVLSSARELVFLYLGRHGISQP